MSRNCWEVMECDCRSVAEDVNGQGPCPASTMVVATGINNGTFGGRACWAIADTFCGNKKSGNCSDIKSTCIECDFYAQVKKEEGAKFKDLDEISDELDGYQLF